MTNDKPCSPTQTWQTCIEQVTIHSIRNHDELVLRHRNDVAEVVFVGDPWCYEAAWEEGNGWVPHDHGKALHLKIDPALRILINCFVITESNGRSSNRVAFWDMGIDTFKLLVEQRERRGLDVYCYTITRLDDDDAEPAYAIAPYRVITGDLKVQIDTAHRLCLATIKGVQHG